MKLKNLEVITDNLYHTDMDLVLYSLLAVKLRKTLKTLKISLVENQRTTPLSNEKETFGHIIRRLNLFPSLENLIIIKGNPPSYQTLDQVIDDCSQTLQRLTISKLELNKWQKEDIKSNQSIKCLDIASFLIDDSSLGYLISKFKALNTLKIMSLTYKTKGVAEKEEHWTALTQLCTSVKAFDISFKYNEVNLKYLVDKCLDILQRIESNERRLRILLIDRYSPPERSFDFSPPRIESRRMPAITISRSSSGVCSIEIGGNTEMMKSNILKHMVNWIQLYAPTSVGFDDGLAKTKYHKLLTISTQEPPELRPYFDFYNKSDIKQFLTRECNGRYWDVFNTLVSSTSTDMSIDGIVLPNVPLSSLQICNDQKELTTHEITIKDSIICPTIFTKVSNPLPWLKSFKL